MLQTSKKQAFTLIETLVWVLIVSIIMIWAFQALTAIWIGKVRLIQKTNTQKQSLYFSEKLFEMIKYGGTLDYEEYFNRKVVNWWTPTYMSWHYLKSTGFWNFWPGWTLWWTTYSSAFYYCHSPSSWTGMWVNWCYASNLWLPQSYWEYSFQFIDYNSNQDWDTHCTVPIIWDQDCDGDIIWDDDDEYLWEWPDVFTLNSNTKELYLINWVKRERTLFRYNIKLDPYAPVWSTCTSVTGENYTGTWCLWTIEYLKLEWRDWWMLLHANVAVPDETRFDGVIDTWLIDEKFSGWTGTVAHSYDSATPALNTNNRYWQSLFPENINVTEFKVFPHPNIDLERAWKESDENQNVAEYVRIQLGMKPAWKDRKMMKWEPKEYKFSTTISLTDIFTQ